MTAAGRSATCRIAQALAGSPNDPCIGPIMEFRVVEFRSRASMLPGFIYICRSGDPSVVPAVLTEQIPIVAPVRTRLVEFGRSGDGNSRDPVDG